MLRELFSTQFIKPQIRTGYLTLIHKKPNYKLQTDFALELRPKNFFEMSNDPAHEHQYAKPGKQISSVTTLLRDLCWDVCNLMHTLSPYISKKPLTQWTSSGFYEFFKK